MTIRMFGYVINVRKETKFKASAIDSVARQQSYRETTQSESYQEIFKKARVIRAQRQARVTA